MKNFTRCALMLSIISALYGCSFHVENTDNDLEYEKPTEIIHKNDSEDTIITMAVCQSIDPKLEKAVNDFNSADHGYQIVYKNYMEFFDSGKVTEYGTSPEAFDPIDTHMSLDIIKGGVVDIVFDGAFMDSGKFDTLAEKGAFIDLNSFMERDDTLNRSDLYESVLDLCSIEGKLVYLPIRFSIDTLVGQTRYVGAKENWNIDELISHWNAMPANATFNGYTTINYVYMDLLRGNLSAYYNVDTGTVSFNSDAFVNVLDFCNSFEKPGNHKDNQAWNTPQFIMHFPISGFSQYHDSLWNIENEPYTFVGYPSEDESGAMIDTTGAKFAISAYSSDKVKEGAWEFLKVLVSYDYQYQLGENYFPINLEAFETRGKEAMDTSDGSNIITVLGNEYDLGYLTIEEYNRLITYIDNIKRVKSNFEKPLMKIVEEELWEMIEGRKNPQKAAEAIQSRAEIFVGEKQ